MFTCDLGIIQGALVQSRSDLIILSVATGYPGDPWVIPSQPRASGVTYIAPRLPRGPAGIREGIQAPIERAPTGLDRLKRIWPLHFLFHSFRLAELGGGFGLGLGLLLRGVGLLVVGGQTRATLYCLESK